MHSVQTILLSAALVAAALVPATGVAAGAAGEEAQAKAAAAATPSAAEARAEEILRATGTYLEGLAGIALKAEETYDELDDDGRRRQFSNMRTLAFRRPDRLAGDVQGDSLNRSVWYDGETLSLHDKRHGVYAVEKVPGTLDGALDHMAKTYDVVLPLTDMAYSKPYEVFRERVERAEYLGIGYAMGVACHHLFIQSGDIEWQIWVESEGVPRPRKMVITYLDEPGLPQFTARILSWNDAPELADGLFEFTPPPGARRVSLADTGGPVQPPTE